MTWVFLLAIVGVAVFAIAWLMTRESRHEPNSSVAPDRRTIGNELVKRASLPPAGAAPTEPTPDNLLQPFSPIPLTVDGASAEAIMSLRAILADNAYDRGRPDQVLAWLLTTNARVKEIDAFLGEWGPKFTTAVKTLCEADPEWALVGELDRDDIRDGACKKAIEHFDVRLDDLDYEVIADIPMLPATADDALLARFGYDTLSFYLRNADDINRVRVVPSDDWYRTRFEDLVAKGLARRGAEVDLKAVLQGLTLKQMEAVAEGIEHKRFTRKAPAVEFLSVLPDLRERLGRHVSMRELFQLLPLPAEFSHIDLAALGHAWAYAAEYAKLLSVTHSTAAWAHRAVTEAVMDEYAKGWSIDAGYGGTACCPSCAKRVGERRGARSAPKLPHHVGCTCQLSQIYG